MRYHCPRCKEVALPCVELLGLGTISPWATEIYRVSSKNAQETVKSFITGLTDGKGRKRRCLPATAFPSFTAVCEACCHEEQWVGGWTWEQEGQKCAAFTLVPQAILLCNISNWTAQHPVHSDNLTNIKEIRPSEKKHSESVSFTKKKRTMLCTH